MPQEDRANPLSRLVIGRRYMKNVSALRFFRKASLHNYEKMQHKVYGYTCRTFENPPGDGKMHWIPGTLEECLESLGILPDTQAAKPKQHL